VTAALALALLLTGCSDDDAERRAGGSDKTSKASPSDFCSAFEANGGSETALRPVPANQPKVVIQGTVDRAVAAMEGVVAPKPIERQWTALVQHYETVAAEVAQLKPAEKLPKKRQRALQRQTDQIFDDSGRAVVNYVLQHCV
jgi:hypothetical protein